MALQTMPQTTTWFHRIVAVTRVLMLLWLAAGGGGGGGGKGRADFNDGMCRYNDPLFNR